MGRRKKTQDALRINLRFWQSLSLTVMCNRAWISSELSYHDNTTEFDYHATYRPPPNNISIKKQIKAIIKSHGSAPPELDWKEIKSSMTISQFQKYGAAAQRFVNKYNAKIQSMNLESSQKMPRNCSFEDILSLSHFINISSPRAVRKLLMSMDDDSLKQIVMNSMYFHLIPKNREKYLNQKHKDSRIHHRILQQIQQTMTEKKYSKYQEHVFDRLIPDLRTNILSFLDPLSLSYVSFTCHSLCKAATVSPARSEIRFSANRFGQDGFSTNTLRQSRFIRALSLIEMYKGHSKKFEKKFKDFLPNCRHLTSIEIDSISSKPAVRALDVLSRADCPISSMTITSIGYGHNPDIPWSLLKRLDRISVSGYSSKYPLNLQRLWVNNAESFSESKFTSHIQQFLHSPSDLKLKRLNISATTSLQPVLRTAHPVYFLWNIPSLRTAAITLSLSNWDDVGDQFEQMLAIPEVLRAAQHQQFKSLVLRISRLDPVFDWNSLFLNIRLLYPNLTEITFEMLSNDVHQQHLRSKIDGSVDWKLAFGGLKHIELDICIDIESATLFVNTMNENEHRFNSIEVFKLKRVIVDQKDKWPRYLDKRNIMTLMPAIDVFLKRQRTKLASFAVILQVKDWHCNSLCRLLEENNGHWEPYSSFFRTLLELFPADDVDECLELRCEFGFRQIVDFESKYHRNGMSERKFWNRIQNDDPVVATNQRNCGVDNMYSNGPLNIAQLICQIQDRVRKNGKGDKVIVKCTGIALEEDFWDFIKFWFKYENGSMTNSHESRLIEFVAQ